MTKEELRRIDDMQCIRLMWALGYSVYEIIVKLKVGPTLVHDTLGVHRPREFKLISKKVIPSARNEEA